MGEWVNVLSERLCCWFSLRFVSAAYFIVFIVHAVTVFGVWLPSLLRKPKSHSGGPTREDFGLSLLNLGHIRGGRPGKTSV